MEKKQKKIKNKRKALCLVTGGAGFIGSHLAEELLSAGYGVRVLDDLSNGRRENFSSFGAHPNFEFKKGSVLSPKELHAAMAGVSLVFHLACLGVRHSLKKPFENHRVNAEGTLLTLIAARAHRVKKFLYCSSSEVYGSAQYVPMDEAHPVRPATVYGASKLAGENYTRAFANVYRMPVVIVRPFNTYGPRSHYERDAGEVIPKSIVRALAGKEILVFGSGRQTRDFTYVKDTARALVLAAESANLGGKTINVGSGFEIPVKQLASKIRTLVGNPSVRIKYEESRPADVTRLFADASLFKKACSWRPSVGFEDGLRKTIDFFKDHPRGIRALIAEETAKNWRGGG